MRGRTRLAALAVAVFVAGTLPAQAIHFYRGTGSGCSAKDGATTDDAGGISGPSAGSVRLLHNAYENASANPSPVGFKNETAVTTIQAGQSLTWTWNSSHCHSVSFIGFGSGFHYPTAPPEGPLVPGGLFDAPILDETPTLSWTHTFSTPGTYDYFCVHHASIGMRGVLIVE